MSIERIEFSHDQRLDAFRSLKTHNTLRDLRLFIAEGATVVERVLSSEFEVQSVLISDRKWNAFHDHLAERMTVYRVSNSVAEELVGFPFHCGVMAAVRRKPSPEWTKTIPPTGSSLVIAGDRIVDPENVGALIRIARAFGADAVLLGAGSADPFSRRVLRVSMGNVLFLPVIETCDLPAVLQHLRTQHQFSVCTATLENATGELAGFRFSPRSVIVMGNEFDGVSVQAAEVADCRLTIPMSNGTDSLNVAIASGIFAWQYRSQHHI